MEMDMVSKAFEQAFVSVSQKLLGLQLQRRKQDNGIFLQQPVRQIMICTSGYLRMEIICDMPESMVLQIVSKMYGGGLPPDEQIPLYIKEYINIVDYYAIFSHSLFHVNTSCLFLYVFIISKQNIPKI